MNTMNEKTQVPPNRYKNTPECETLLEIALLQESLHYSLELESWFSSVRISASRMNDHDTFAEAGAAGCVYELHDENLFTVEQVVSLMDTFEKVMRIEGLNHSHYQFSIHIEGPDGKWLPPVNGVPLDRILNVINLCSFWQEGLVADDEEARQLESAADSIIAQVLPLLGVEAQQHLSLAWSRASAEIHSKFLTL
jgi:hypothetical protein